MGDIYETYETEIGAFYVRVRASRIDAFWSGGAHVRQERGQLVVGTNPECNVYVDGGGVKIRGRVYRTSNTYARNVPPYLTGWDGKPNEWDRDVQNYISEYRNDRGTSVPYDTATRKRLVAGELEALARFEADHPDWVRDSRRLRLEGERDNALTAAATAHLEWEKQVVKANDLAAEIDALSD
jgi:hypothetical protein